MPRRRRHTNHIGMAYISKKDVKTGMTSPCEEEEATFCGERTNGHLDRPLAVGYAFMAKKMGTMGAVVRNPKVVGDETCVRPVEFRAIDMDRPVEDQGPFDVILHKLSEDVRLMFSSPEAERRIKELETYVERHPRTVLVEHPRDIRKIVSRAETCRVLKEMHDSLGEAAAARPPRFVVVEKGQTGRRDLAEVMSNAPFSYPIICKPVAACGSSDSHRLIVAVNEAGLDLVQAPMVLQEYSNHNSVLYKVYVLGDLVKVYERPSLPNLTQRARNIAFDSQKPYPSEKDFDGSLEPGEEAYANGYESIVAGSEELSPFMRTTCPSSLPFSSGVPCEEKIRLAAAQISRAFHLELFGFDLIRCNDTGDLIVVDVNYFPSYKELKDFPVLLCDFLRRKVEGENARRAAGVERRLYRDNDETSKEHG